MKLVEGVQLNELVGYKGSDEFQGFKEYLGSQPDVKSWAGRGNMLLDFIKFLTGRGFVNLGKGAFGAVFEHPKLEYAIKIFRNDPAYLTFIRFAQSRPDNPHLPKFRGKQIKLDRDNFVVRMEKLTKMTPATAYYVEVTVNRVRDYGSEEWIKRCRANLETENDSFTQIVEERLKEAQRAMKAVENELNDIIQTNAEFSEIERLQNKLQAARDHFLDVRNDYQKIKDRTQDRKLNLQLWQFVVNHQVFCHTIQEIIDLDGQYTFDLHNGNILLRGTVPVIIDPLASEKYL